MASVSFMYFVAKYAFAPLFIIPKNKPFCVELYLICNPHHSLLTPPSRRHPVLPFVKFTIPLNATPLKLLTGIFLLLLLLVTNPSVNPQSLKVSSVYPVLSAAFDINSTPWKKFTTMVRIRRYAKMDFLHFLTFTLFPLFLQEGVWSLPLSFSTLFYSFSLCSIRNKQYRWQISCKYGL